MQSHAVVETCNHAHPECEGWARSFARETEGLGFYGKKSEKWCIRMTAWGSNEAWRDMFRFCLESSFCAVL